MLKRLLIGSCILGANFLLAAPSYAKSHTGLLPQKVYLSSSHGNKPRELYITILNTNPRIFKNNENPITVLINGTPYEGKIYAKKYNERYYLWADIRSQEEGAIFVSFRDNAPYKNWKQCDKLKITIDPQMKLAKANKQKYYPNQQLPKDEHTQDKQNVETYTLYLHDKDYASDCRYAGEGD